MKNIVHLIQKLSDQNFVSGEDLASELNVSRATISTWMNELGQLGLDINKVRGRGYRLANPVSLLDKNRVLSSFSSHITKDLSVVDVVLSTPSTNELAAAAIYNDSRWHLYSTEYQESGRGRRGRNWVSPLGANLLFTLSSRRQWSLDVLYLGSIITGLAVAELLNERFSLPVKLKWPNDLYIGQKKLGGILCELRGSPQDESLFIIGTGINVLAAPDTTDIESACLSDFLAEPPERSRLLAEISEKVLSDVDYASRAGVSELLKSWARFDCLHGKNVRVIKGEQVVEGMARGIDEKGQLKIYTNEGVEMTFNGGEVSVRW